MLVAMGAPSPDTPLVSIITATHNRSNVLAYTLESVQRSTVADWEHLVIGDACTDDTALVTAGLGDARVRFHNLAENFGEQSGPNNAGFALSRGSYIAYLNHDDLWFPDHLELQLGTVRPGLVVVPPRVWHGVQSVHAGSSSLLNLVDRAYRYERPDHWRLPPDTDEIPYRFTTSRATSGLW